MDAITKCFEAAAAAGVCDECKEAGRVVKAIIRPGEMQDYEGEAREVTVCQDDFEEYALNLDDYWDIKLA